MAASALGQLGYRAGRPVAFPPINVGEVWRQHSGHPATIASKSDDPNANFYRVDDFLTVNAAIPPTPSENDTRARWHPDIRVRAINKPVRQRIRRWLTKPYGYLSALHTPRGAGVPGSNWRKPF